MIHVQMPTRNVPAYPTGEVPHRAAASPVSIAKVVQAPTHWDVVDNWPLDQRGGYYRGEALRHLMELGNTPTETVAAVVRAQHYLEKLLTVAREMAP